MSIHRRMRVWCLAMFVGVLFVSIPATPRVHADLQYQLLPFSQNWSNTSLIADNDIWVGVPGIVGYRGDTLTGAAGTDPQTILGVDEGLITDVNANQTNPDTFGTGGVAEFELANPVVALQGSGTADAPYLQLFLNTSARQAVTVSYNLRDIDGSVDNAAQAVALQYRIGTSGNFTNVPAGFVADATEGPSLATKVTPVSATLPTAANDQPQVQIRIMTSNAVNNDEWVGIDDIQVTGTPIEGDVAPIVLSTTPANGATLVPATTDITVTFSEAVTVTENSLTLTCGGAAQPFALSGSGATYTLNPTNDLPLGAFCRLVVLAAQVTDLDDAPTPMAVNYESTFTIVAPLGNCPAATVNSIGSVQGNGAASPLVNQDVAVQGRIVGDFQGSGRLGGFFVQDAGDGDLATSDGLFVEIDLPDVSVGDLVQVTGTVTETFGLTQIADPAVVPCAITTPPTITPAVMDLPVASEADLERLEGMLVNFPETLYVTENFQLGRFGELVLSADGRLFNPTNIVDPNDDPASGTSFTGNSNVDDVTALQTANTLRRIVLDDGRNSQNPATVPYLNAQNTRRIGDSVTSLTGVLSYGFSAYRVQPTVAPVFADTNPRPTNAPAVGGNLKVASFNVLNYFNTFDQAGSACYPNPPKQDNCRGANSQAEFDRQRAKVFAALRGMDADIVGLIELENDGDGSSSAIQDLVNGLNESIVVAGGQPNTYAFVEDPDGYGPESSVSEFPGGDDAIKVALIYKPAKVTPVGAAVASADAAFENARAPVAQTFELAGTDARLSVVINHFKSKSGTGSGADADQDDGQGAFNASRVNQAAALLGFINDVIVPAAGDPDVLVLGDLNAYTQEDPVDRLRAAGLANLIDSGVAYSYVFGGQSGSLDHALATASLQGQVTAAEKWHINADEPLLLDYNLEFKPGAVAALFQPDPFRSSDHDPVLVGLNVAPAPPLPGLKTYLPLIST